MREYHANNVPTVEKRYVSGGLAVSDVLNVRTARMVYGPGHLSAPAAGVPEAGRLSHHTDHLGSARSEHA